MKPAIPPTPAATTEAEKLAEGLKVVKKQEEAEQLEKKVEKAKSEAKLVKSHKEQTDTAKVQAIQASEAAG